MSSLAQVACPEGCGILRMFPYFSGSYGHTKEYSENPWGNSEIPDGIIFQYNCTRKALTIVGIMRCGPSIVRGDMIRSAICCYYYFALEKRTYFWFLYFCQSQLCSMIHHHNCILSNTNCLFLGWYILHPSETHCPVFIYPHPKGWTSQEK